MATSAAAIWEERPVTRADEPRLRMKRMRRPRVSSISSTPSTRWSDSSRRCRNCSINNSLRESILIQIDSSRIILLGKLKEYRGEELEVIHEVAVFLAKRSNTMTALSSPHIPPTFLTYLFWMTLTLVDTS